MKTKYYIAASGVLINLLAACNGGSKPNAQLTATMGTKQVLTASGASVLDSVKIGNGVYPQDTSISPFLCVNFDSIDVSNKGNSYATAQALKDYQSISNELNVSSDVKASYGLFSGSAQASYLNSVKNDNSKIHYVFVSRYSRPVIGQNPSLSPLGKEKANAGPLTFQAMCGTNTVIAQNLGAYLVASVDISTSSAVATQQIQASLNFSYSSFVDFTTKVQSTVKKTGLDVALNLHLYQYGGDPSKLNTIIGEAKDGIINCDVNNPDKCNSIAQTIATYIGDTTNGFAAQTGLIQKASTYNDILSAGGVNLGSPQEMSNNLFLPGTGEPADFYKKSSKLFALYNQQKEKQAALVNLGSLTQPLSTANQAVSRMKSVINQNLELLNNEIAACMSGSITCSPDTNDIEALNASDVMAVKSFAAVGLLLSNNNPIAPTAGTFPIPTTASFIIANDNGKLMFSAIPGYNYIYNGIYHGQTLALGIQLPSQYTGAFYLFDGQSDQISFNGNLFYLTYGSEKVRKVFSDNVFQIDSPDIGLNGLPTTDTNMVLQQPQTTNFTAGGSNSYSYHYVAINPDFTIINTPN